MHEKLERLLGSKRIPQSLLFSGGNLFSHAVDFAGALVQKAYPHMDIHVLRPEGKLGMYSMEALWRFVAEVAFPPYEAVRKVFILDCAERMLAPSANALLKTFEEPTPDTTVILLSERPDQLLPTILSRSVRLHFPVDNQVVEISTKAEKLWIELLAYWPMTYTELMDQLKGVQEALDSERKALEVDLKEEMQTRMPAEPSAKLKHEMEKELEGSLSLMQKESVQKLLKLLLIWVRDILYLKLGGKTPLLEGYGEQLKESFKQRLSLSKTQNAVFTAMQDLERSTPIQTILEDVLLKN